MCVVKDLQLSIENLFHEASALGLSGLDDDQMLHLSAVTVELHERLGALVGAVLHAGQERLVAARAGHRTMEGERSF